MEWFSYIPLIIQSASAIKRIIDVASSNADVVEKITAAVPDLAELLGSIGSKLFPKVAPQLSIAAGAMGAFDPDITKWLQGSLNVLVEPSPNLEVDGIYGPKTRAAVEQLQTKLGLTTDGWAGVITQTAIANLLVKRPTL